MPLLIVTAALLIYGILALFSVSVHESFLQTLKWIADNRWEGDPSNYYYFFNQLKNFLYVIVLAGFIYFIPLKLLKHRGFLIFLSIFIVGFQLLVFTPLGKTYGGATGRLYIQGLPSIQPVEIFKLGYVIFTARWLMKRKSSLQEPKVLLNFLILNTLIAVFFATLPDLGSVLIMLGTSMLMGMYVGINIKHILSAIIVGLSGVGLALRGSISINNNYCKDQTIESRPGFCKYSYLVNRFEVFIDPSSDASGQGVSWQGRQALISIGGGGFRGRGYGKGLQKFGYIPEAQSDFIFSAYAEEVGFIGIFILFLLYSLLVYIVLSRVHLVRDPLFQYIAIGLLSLLIIEALIHMGVNLQVLPNTGITLPFVSHGSTSMLGNIVCIVLLYKILYKDYYKLY